MELFLPIPRTLLAGNDEVTAVDPGDPRAEKYGCL